MSASSDPNQPRIAIVGGGPGGLVLLLTLLRRGVPATLYEREADKHSRAHLGGMLDLDWASGQRALRENGLEDVFRKNSRRDAEEAKVCGKDGVALFHEHGRAPEDKDKDDLKNTRPEIDRRVLREVLLDAIPADAIKWGHGLTAIRPLGDGTHELTFSNGLVTVADVVVGADGAHSRVRPLVSAANPIYHGVTGAELILPPSVAARPENADINAGVGQGSCFVAQDEKMLAFQRNGDGRIRAYAMHRAPADWALPSDPKQAKAALLEIFHDWAPWMRRFIEIADDNTIYLRPLYHLPVGQRWEHTRGVTLIGDAAHLMSPFAGAGANLAMLDGLQLGLVLAGAQEKGSSAEEREAAIAEWEEEMFSRVKAIAALTAKNLEAFFSTEAPRSAAEAFEHTHD